MTEPPPCSHSAAHGRLAASVPVPVPPASADEWPLVPGRSSELLRTSPVQGSAVAQAPAAPMADGRSRADPEDVLPLSAASLAQARVLPASLTRAAGFLTLSPAALHDPAPVAAPRPHSHPVAHGGSAASVPVLFPLASADEWPLVS